MVEGAKPDVELRGGAFGLCVTSRVALPGTWGRPSPGRPELRIESAARSALEADWTGAARLGWEGRVDGHPFVVEHGKGGDLRMALGDAATLHLSPEASLLRVDAAGDRLLTQRLLLDSALFTVSLARGHDALHAGAVELPDGSGLLAIMGATGAGKSSLLASLLAAGASFFTDDVLVLEARDGGVDGLPGPPAMSVPPTLDPTEQGEPIAAVGADRWVAMRGADAARPLRAVVHLGGTRAAADGLGWPALLGNLLRFPRDAERERGRFELAHRLSSGVPRIGLIARSAPPAELASMALVQLDRFAGDVRS